MCVATRAAFSVFLLAFVFSCSKESPPPAEAVAVVTESKLDALNDFVNQQFLDATDEFALELLLAQPLRASSLGIDEALLGEKVSDKIGDFGLERISRDKASTDKWLAHFITYEPEHLSAPNRIIHQSLVSSLARAKQMQGYSFGSYGVLGAFSPYIITQLSGPHLGLPRALINDHQVNTVADAEDYLSRLTLIGPALADVSQVLRYEIAQGNRPPSFALTGAHKSITRYTDSAPAAHPLVVSFAEKIDALTELTEAQHQQFTKRAEEIVKQSVYPGYSTLKDTLAELTESSSEYAGIWDLSDGDTRYSLFLNRFGAQGMSPEQVHQLGLNEVERIEYQMESLLDSIDIELEGNTLAQKLDALSVHPRQIYEDSEAGREQLITDQKMFIERIKGLSKPVFNRFPKADIEIKPVPIHEQANSALAYYRPGSIDGARPGVYWVNLKDMKALPKYKLGSLSAHEAIPGHHFDLSIALERTDRPLISKLLWYAEFSEGWALYAEKLAWEIGAYDNDPLANLGRLYFELMRAVRLVTDTGLHAKRWSREGAIQYMNSKLGGDYTSEVERYAVWPGQACSYKLGMIKFESLRDYAEDSFGKSFTLAEYHDTVLENGAVPLDVLEQIVRGWVLN